MRSYMKPLLPALAVSLILAACGSSYGGSSLLLAGRHDVNQRELVSERAGRRCREELVEPHARRDRAR